VVAEDEGVSGDEGGSKVRRPSSRVGPVVSTLRLPPCSAVASSHRPLPFDPPNNQYILT